MVEESCCYCSRTPFVADVVAHCSIAADACVLAEAAAAVEIAASAVEIYAAAAAAVEVVVAVVSVAAAAEAMTTRGCTSCHSCKLVDVAATQRNDLKDPYH